MYLPYLRSKQSEMLALRVLAPQLAENGNVIPIIELVNWPGSTRKTLEEFVKYDLEACVVLNPREGNFKKRSIIPDEILNYLMESPNIIYTFIIDKKTNLEVLEEYVLRNLSDKKISLVHMEAPNSDEYLPNFIQTLTNIAFNVVTPDIPNRYVAVIDKFSEGNNKVLLTDSFPKKDRNQDYLHSIDELFTKNHYFYKEEGFIGFSDYTIIGSKYSDSGFFPYAVAIHITYPKSDREIWVQHFVSDTIDDDPKKVGLKTKEALIKLVGFADKEMIHSIGLEEFQLIQKEERGVNLGVLKKLSIIHHLEMVLQLKYN